MLLAEVKRALDASGAADAIFPGIERRLAGQGTRTRERLVETMPPGSTLLDSYTQPKSSGQGPRLAAYAGPGGVYVRAENGTSETLRLQTADTVTIVIGAAGGDGGGRGVGWITAAVTGAAPKESIGRFDFDTEWDDFPALMAGLGVIAAAATAAAKSIAMVPGTSAESFALVRKALLDAFPDRGDELAVELLRRLA